MKFPYDIPFKSYEVHIWNNTITSITFGVFNKLSQYTDLSVSVNLISGHPLSIPLQLQFIITVTHLSALISLKIFKSRNQPEILPFHNGCYS